LGCETEREMTLALLRLVIAPPVVPKREILSHESLPFRRTGFGY